MNVAFQTGANILNDKSLQKNLNEYSTINPLMQGFYKRGVKEVFHYNTNSIYKKNGSLFADGYLLGLKSLSPDGIFSFEKKPLSVDLENFDIIFLRGDDVNEKTLKQTMLVDTLRNPAIINSGAGTLATRDKFEIPTRFYDALHLIPETICVYNMDDLVRAYDVIQSDLIVLKSRYGSGGAGVDRFSRDKKGLAKATKFFKDVGEVVAQEYLDEVSQGDVRVHVFDGEIIGSFKRLPGTDWVTNLYRGGVLKPVKLSSKLADTSLFIANNYFFDVRLNGIDLAYKSGKFIEANAFPASIGSLNKLYGGFHEDIILDSLLN